MRPVVTTWFARLGFAWARNRLAAETRRELEMHRDLLVERYVRSGMSPDAARTAACRQMGNTTLVAEDVYSMNGLALIDGVRQDLRYALRQLPRSPGFAAIVVATLALGIGGTTAVFSAVQAVLLAPLPYQEPGQLVRLYQQEPGKPETRNVMAGTHFTFLRDRSASFEDMAALDTYGETGLDLVSDGRAHRLRVLRVTSGYFTTLASSPQQGQGFDRDDESGTRRIVLSEATWRTRFASDRAVIGRTIQLSGQPFEVVGIAARGFEDPIVSGVDAWVPYSLARDTYEENNSLSAVARLRNGISLQQAGAELAMLSLPMKERWPASRFSEIIAVPLQADLVAPARGPLHLLLVAVGLVLLVACVNVANLVLVRATGRVQEFAIRSALGSGRGRLARHLLMESVVLAALGGVLGLMLAVNGIALLRRLGRDALPRLDEIGLDPIVLGFAALVTVVTAVGCGVAPALRLARTAPVEALRQQSRSTTGTRGQNWVRNGLATAQLSLALTLLVGAGVLMTSFYRIQHVDLGFRVDRVLTFEVNLPTVRYDAPRRVAFHEEVARTIRTIPGVTAAGATSRLPATGVYHPWNTRVISGPRAGTAIGRATGFNIQQRTISGDVFSALGIAILAGRQFDDRDDAGAPLHAVVSANFARQGFPGLPFDGVIGQRIAVVGRQLSIIGVVSDVAFDVYGAPALVVYHAHRQFADNRNWPLTQVVASQVAPEHLVEPVRAAIARLDPELAVHHVAAMSDVVGRSSSRERFAFILMGAFATVALMLAALGLYGVLAYGVRQRTREIGIRMALGANAAEVRGLVLKQAAVILATGVAAGAAGAMVLSRWLSALVFETSPSDPRILLGTAALLTITGLVAAWLPARRAARVEPTVAIQQS